MLTFTSQPNQKIVIGEGITITILEVTEDEVYFGIDTPPDTLVVPGEELQLHLLALQTTTSDNSVETDKAPRLLARKT